MLNIIIASDDQDADIGPNCTLSYQHLLEAVNLDNHNLTLLNGPLCVAAQVENAITSFNQEKFVLIAYSHGTEEALISAAALDGYVTTNNSTFFATSLVYTNSCMTGLKLMASMAAAGCYGYVGYTDVVKLPYNEEDDILFIACENKGLVHFMTTEDSLTDSVEMMRKQYRSQYDEFRSQQMNVAAALLLHNLGCLTYYDPDSLTMSKLEV